MEFLDWIELVLSVLAGIIACSPIVIALCKNVVALVKEKRWSQLVKVTLELMESAEVMFDDGQVRKEWVLQEVREAADLIGYEVDMEVVAKMIDDLCSMSKIVNAPADVDPEQEILV